VFWSLNFKIYQNSYAFYLKNNLIPVSIQFPIFKFVLGVFIMTPRLNFAKNLLRDFNRKASKTKKSKLFS